MTESKPSKSERKRQQRERQALGEQLIELSDVELGGLQLDDRLAKAIRDARAIRSHGALRRQKQLIGKLMRDIDPEPIRAYLSALRADDLQAKRTFATAEKWRDRIAREGQAGLEAFESECGVEDAKLRALVGDLDIAFSDRAETTIRRNIFRRVHELIS